MIWSNLYIDLLPYRADTNHEYGLFYKHINVGVHISTAVYEEDTASLLVPLAFNIFNPYESECLGGDISYSTAGIVAHTYLRNGSGCSRYLGSEYKCLFYAPIAVPNAYALYLAYHEGQNGFNRGTYKNKAWLKKAAKEVSSRASYYNKQLQGCRKRLEGPWWWPF